MVLTPVQTHQIYAFHPTVTHLHNLEIVTPWKKRDPMYPPPLEVFLKAHFESSVAWWMKAGAEEYLDSDDSDEEELPELQAGIGSNEDHAWIQEWNSNVSPGSPGSPLLRKWRAQPSQAISPLTYDDTCLSILLTVCASVLR